ncbi:beta-defensin 1 [Rattus rattus]|uniref:beta-defensin 1 n=1 Tax=Rattus rattus TaxID=10117 RepID=UPI0013F350AA|nr:beta-defensin 1 [Rattus rattus]
MKTHYFLLVMLFFLFSQMELGAGILTSLGRRTDQYRCLQNGGFCLRSSCPSHTKLQGTCKPDKPNCCKS